MIIGCRSASELSCKLRTWCEVESHALFSCQFGQLFLPLFLSCGIEWPVSSERSYQGAYCGCWQVGKCVFEGFVWSCGNQYSIQSGTRQQLCSS